MFAAATTPFSQEFHIVVAVIAFGITAPIESEPAAAGAADVEGVVDEQHSHGFTDRDVQNLLFDDFSVLQRYSGDGLSILATQQQSTFGVFGHADPGSID